MNIIFLEMLFQNYQPNAILPYFTFYWKALDGL